MRISVNETEKKCRMLLVTKLQEASNGHEGIFRLCDRTYTTPFLVGRMLQALVVVNYQNNCNKKRTRRIKINRPGHKANIYFTPTA